MGLFDALNGRIEHFNKIAVSIHNNIGAKIKELPDKMDTLFFALSLDLIASKIISLLFRPEGKSVIKTVKEYNQKDIRNLYSIFMIWALYDFDNYFHLVNPDEQKNKLQKILGLNKGESDYYFNRLKHETKPPIKLDKLWEEVTKIMHTLPKTKENYLVFHRKFSRICKEAFQEFGRHLDTLNKTK